MEHCKHCGAKFENSPCCGRAEMLSEYAQKLEAKAARWDWIAKRFTYMRTDNLWFLQSQVIRTKETDLDKSVDVAIATKQPTDD